MTTETEKVIHRKPYVQKQSAGWWTKNNFYLLYMLREATAVLVFLYSLVLMWGLLRLVQGEEAWNAWVQSMFHPVYMVFHFLVLAAALYHAYTFFKMFPKVLVLRIGDWKMPESQMIAGQWVGFALCSVVLLGIALFVGV